MVILDICGFKEFHGLHDDLKIIQKKLTPGRYPVPKKVKLKKRDLCDRKKI